MMTCARVAMGIALLTIGCSGLQAQSNGDALRLSKPLPLAMDQPVLEIAVSPNGKIVAVGCEEGLQLLRADNLRPISRLDSSKGNAASIAFSANSKIVATVGEDRHPSFWSADDGRLLNTAIEKRWGWRVEAHTSLLQCITSGGNPAISKWNMVSGELMQEVQTDFDHMGAIMMLPGGKQFISCGVYRNGKSSRYKMELRDYATLKPIKVLQEAKNQVFAMSISADESKLGFVTQNGLAEIWDLKSLTPLHKTQLDQTKTTKLHFLPDDRSVIVAGWFRKLMVWDFVGGDVRELKYPTTGGLTSMAYLRSPDRLLLGSGQADFKLAVAEVQSKGRVAMPPRDPKEGLNPTGSGGRLARPADNLLEEARKRVAAVVDSNTNPEELLDLVHQEDDAAAKFALLEQAVNLAIEKGDQRSCEATLAALDAIFIVDLPKLAGSAIRRAVNKGIAKEDRAAWSAWSEHMGDEADLNERIDFAESFYGMAFDLRAQSSSPAGAKNIKFKRNAMQKLLPQFHKMVAAKKALEGSPNDQGAHERVGYYYAFVRSQWRLGLQYLAKGQDDALRKLAAADLKADKTVAEMDELSNRWKQLSESTLDTQVQAAAIQSARFWLTQALPQTKGLEKASLMKRLQNLESDYPPRSK